MATVTITRNKTLPNSSSKADFHDLVDTATGAVSGITSSDLDLSSVSQKIIMTSKAIDFAKGADIASATTTDIGAATGNCVDVTGTVTITGLGTIQAGTVRLVRFTGALTLTHNATSLILPGSANITTANGDVAGFESLGSGNWKCLFYQRQNGTAISSSFPTHSRIEMNVMQASTTTITVGPGNLEVNGTAISKTSNTTLTISTAGDWAGGSSLRAANTTAYVGVDASGNIKMHTTAPTHADYALSITAANNTKRYASWSSTTYRIIGWFRMNGTGSGELDTYGVSNIADSGVRNVVERQYVNSTTGSTAIPNDDTVPQNTEGDQFMTINFVPTNVNNKLKIEVVCTGNSSGQNYIVTALFQDSTANAIAISPNSAVTGNIPSTCTFIHNMKAATTSLTTFNVRAGSESGTYTFNGTASARKYGGAITSLIRVEEIPSQLT